MCLLRFPARMLDKIRGVELSANLTGVISLGFSIGLACFETGSPQSRRERKGEFLCFPVRAGKHKAQRSNILDFYCRRPFSLPSLNGKETVFLCDSASLRENLIWTR